MRNYKTQMDAAKKGIVTPQMEIVAKKEGIDVNILRQRIANGTVVIPANKMHTALSPEGIGEGLRTKINVNLRKTIFFIKKYPFKLSFAHLILHL